jgi:PiT family inorganic phosphate transporter
MIVLLILLVALLAFANGSNDNGKGVATLVGFGVAQPRRALLYATITTAIGGIISFCLAGGLLKGFSGSWLFAGSANLDARFYVAVLIGACGWVLLASRTGMPVSTTHAIIGALCGSGLVAFGNASVQWSALGMKFAVPLALSPLLSLAIVYAIAWPVLFIVARVVGKCVCVVEQEQVVAIKNIGGTAVARIGGLEHAVVVDTEARCAAEQPILAVNASATANAVHWLSAGLISFARGWNDTPKIAALSLLALAGVAHGMAIGFAIVTLAMAAGGLLAGRRVLETMGRKLTPLPLAESLTASMVTASLVALASWQSLPVSTTHVATGAIIGAGLKNNPAGVKWAKVIEIVLSWVITLPVAALIAAVAKVVLR